MPIIPHISSGYSGSIQTVGGGQAMTDRLVRAVIGMPEPEGRAIVHVDAVLLQALRCAGIARAGDGDRLTSVQQETMLANRPVAQRIQLKMLCERAGITPRGH